MAQVPEARQFVESKRLAPVNIDSGRTATDNAKSAKCALHHAASLAVVHVPFWNSLPTHLTFSGPPQKWLWIDVCGELRMSIQTRFSALLLLCIGVLLLLDPS